METGKWGQHSLIWIIASILGRVTCFKVSAVNSTSIACWLMDGSLRFTVKSLKEGFLNCLTHDPWRLQYLTCLIIQKKRIMLRKIFLLWVFLMFSPVEPTFANFSPSVQTPRSGTVSKFKMQKGSLETWAVQEGTVSSSDFGDTMNRINGAVTPNIIKGSEVNWKSLSCVWLFVTIQSMGFSRPEYWSGYPFPSPGDLPDPGMKPGSPPLQADSSPAEPQGKPKPKRASY